MKNWYLDWFFGALGLLSYLCGLGFPQAGEAWWKILGYAAFYAYACRYLNPDLDIRTKRCGYRSAPLGFLCYALRRRSWRWLYRCLWPWQKLGNALHNLIWWPLGRLFTHRGILHWPLIGTGIKVSWLYLLTLPWLSLSGTASLELYLKLWQSPWVLTWALADLSHIASDIVIARIQNRKQFVPPAFIAPRGLIMRLFRVKATRWFAI